MVKMPHWPVPIWNVPNIKFDKLTRMENLLEAVGNPHLKMPPTIHVAGTNGKGSTIAFIKAILQEAGLTSHTYTSPHLHEFNERINIAGKKISNEALFEVIEQCRIAAEKHEIPVTFFEGTTVAAFLAFAKFEADFCLLETGLGGRLDATNVFPNPVMTIITSISLDHQEYLGETIAEIASEKSGIMKKNAPNIISQQYEEILPIFNKKAEELGIENHIFEYDFIAKPKSKTHFIYQDQNHEMTLPNPALVGSHQLINAATAIFACLNLKNIEISQQHIEAAMHSVKWPARLEKITSGTLFKQAAKTLTNFEVWFDGAHNIGGAAALNDWLEQNTDENTTNYAICGTTKGKDFINILALLKDNLTKIYGVTVESEQSSYSADYIAEMAKIADIPSQACLDAEDAIHAICQEVSHSNQGKNKIRILIFGSLYLADIVAL